MLVSNGCKVWELGNDAMIVCQSFRYLTETCWFSLQRLKWNWKTWCPTSKKRRIKSELNWRVSKTGVVDLAQFQRLDRYRSDNWAWKKIRYAWTLVSPISPMLSSDRTKYRARGTHEQILGGLEDTQDTALDAFEEVCRGDDGVQSDANRLQRTV